MTITVDPHAPLGAALELPWPRTVLSGRPRLYVEDLPVSTRNEHRASRAVLALKAYALGEANVAGELDEPTEQIVRDLISDLIHLCDLFPDTHDYGFHDMVDRAVRMHRDEVSEP